MDEVDKELERRGHKFVRCADDCMILCKSRRSAERTLEHIIPYITGKLYLKVNPEKTTVSHISKVKYLGYGFAACLTTNMIANMGKEGKHISMDTLARICETLDCGIMDVIDLVSDEPSTTGGNDNGKTEKRITENGIDYILVGDYYIPDLKLPEESRPIGRYGRLHREYLKQEHPARYSSLILTGKLWTYLADLNEQAEERMDLIIEQMKAAEGVTEELKAQNQFGWVGWMNNIRNRTEEIIKSRMISS